MADIKKRFESVSAVSETFCLAKWLQSTILLYNGSTHSCAHPVRHQIEKKDLAGNPSAIHNTPVKIRARQDMLNGIQTPECSYCWDIENLKKGHLSDRALRSTYSWSFPHLKEVIESGLGERILPSYLEIAFSSGCNCKCLYCSPESSSAWESEIRQHGGIPLSEGSLYDLNELRDRGVLPIPDDQANPYIDAFWEWWPELHKNLRVLRVTGGEPLLSAKTWKLLDLLEDLPRKDLNFSINSNLCVSESLVEKLCRKVNLIQPKIKSFDIYTSLESVNEQIEYVRYGMNFKQFTKNCRTLLENTPRESKLYFTTTINLLSAPGFLDHLEFLNQLRLKYPGVDSEFRVRTSINHLRFPHFLSIGMLPEFMKSQYAEAWTSYLEKNMSDSEDKKSAFLGEELDQVKRLIDYMSATKPSSKHFADFRLFIKSIDKRRNLNFSKVFSEFEVLLQESYFG